MVRTDACEAHRLSVSARVLSPGYVQVNTKARLKKRLSRLVFLHVCARKSRRIGARVARYRTESCAIALQFHDAIRGFARTPARTLRPPAESDRTAR